MEKLTNTSDEEDLNHQKLFHYISYIRHKTKGISMFSSFEMHLPQNRIIPYRFIISEALLRLFTFIFRVFILEFHYFQLPILCVCIIYPFFVLNIRKRKM